MYFLSTFPQCAYNLFRAFTPSDCKLFSQTHVQLKYHLRLSFQTVCETRHTAHFSWHAQIFLLRYPPIASVENTGPTQKQVPSLPPKSTKPLVSGFFRSFLLCAFWRSDYVAVPREATLEEVANVKNMVLIRADLLAGVVTRRSYQVVPILHTYICWRFIHFPFRTSMCISPIQQLYFLLLHCAFRIQRSRVPPRPVYASLPNLQASTATTRTNLPPPQSHLGARLLTHPWQCQCPMDLIILQHHHAL